MYILYSMISCSGGVEITVTLRRGWHQRMRLCCVCHNGLVVAPPHSGEAASKETTVHIYIMVLVRCDGCWLTPTRLKRCVQPCSHLLKNSNFTERLICTSFLLPCDIHAERTILAYQWTSSAF